MQSDKHKLYVTGMQASGCHCEATGKMQICGLCSVLKCWWLDKTIILTITVTLTIFYPFYYLNITSGLTVKSLLDAVANNGMNNFFSYDTGKIASTLSQRSKRLADLERPVFLQLREFKTPFWSWNLYTHSTCVTFRPLPCWQKNLSAAVHITNVCCRAVIRVAGYMLPCASCKCIK